MKNDDDLLLIGPLDQPIPASNDEILQKIESIIMQAAVEHNQWKALKVCRELVQVQKITGLGLARALFLVRKNWKEFRTEDQFEDVAYEYIGIHRHTVERYVAVWEMFEAGYVPKELSDDLKQRNIKELIPVANALAQGFEISQDQWEQIVSAPDFSTVSKIVREDIKGAEPRSGSMMLSMDDMGSIWCFYNGERYFVGSLEVDADQEVIKKAIERILTNSGVLRQ